MQYSPRKMNELIDNNNFKFKKKFGQNFIVDENIIDNIVDGAKVDSDTTVIEIGPGAGSLTYKLSEKAEQVICYEIDTTLKEVLDATLIDCNNVYIYFKDFLKSDVINDLKSFDYKKLYVVANLPYYITTPIITKFIEDKIPVDKIVVMVQKEVGDRFKATPGTKDYNSLSIYLNYYFDVKKLLDVSKNVFMPKPNVDSVVVEFTRKKDTYKLKDDKAFFKLVRDAFVQKRKNLRNNLKSYNLEKVEEVLKKYNYDLTVRAEQLPIEVFVDISNNL